MFPKDPGKAVVQAHTLGLRALVNLLRERTNKDTKHLHSKAQSRLNTALAKWDGSVDQGQPDFSPVANQEKGLRDLELENIWETTASYGNTEIKRVRNEREGIVGPLNRLINIFGAKLRDYFLLMYPLETPVKIGQQKRKSIWGYNSNEFGPVPVAHGADLAELDLADMIRSHGRELCRKSFIFGVAPNDFDQYALLLIRRLATFVDQVYSDKQIGNEHFLHSRTKTSRQGHCADEILRELVDELNCLYATNSTQRVFPSRVRVDDDQPPEEEFFQYQIAKLRKESKFVSKEEARRLQTWARFLKKLTPKKNPKLRAQDVRYLYEIVRKKVRWEGLRYHRLITDGLPQAYNIESIIMEGDRFLKPGEDYLLVGETRLRTSEGPGRIDLALFARTVVTNPTRPGQLVVMKPVAVFDIKTRTGFNWEIRTKKPKGKRKKNVARFIVRKRGLTEDEWNDALAEVPTKSDALQLTLYASALMREYRRLTGDESVSDILKGVVLLDTQFDVGLNRRVVRSLIEDILSKSNMKECDRLLIRSKDPLAQRAALVIHSPKEEQFTVLESERTQQEIVDKYDPFSEIGNTDTKHILYLSARSASNSGLTAAWLAQYWHGLLYLQKLSSELGNASVTWLDLSGNLSHNELAKKRLRISHQTKKVRDFFDKIEVIDMSQEIDQFLFHGGNLPDIASVLPQALVVVSGLQWIEDSLPPRHRPFLEELERYMIQEISKTELTSVWFVQPRPDERTSEKYHSRCIIPFWKSSEHRFHVTDFVWNLPVRPYTTAQTTPMLDDLRVIVKQTKESVETELVEVPILENWSARFWSKKSKRKIKKRGQTGTRGRDALAAEHILKMNQLSRELIGDSIDLIPWLCILHPRKCKKDDAEEIGLTTQVIPLYGKPMKPKSVMSRMVYRVKVRGVKGKRGYIASQDLIPKEAITHPRHYRRHRRKKRRTLNTQTYRAPDESHLEFRKLREQTARNVEIRRFKQTLKLLSRQTHPWTKDVSWQDLLRQLGSIIPDNGGVIGKEELDKISELFMIHDATSDLWELLLWIRERRLGSGLRLSEQDHLDSLLESRPFVATIYGNYLFILLVALKKKHPNLRIDHIQSLWSTVKSWHLKQIGFYLRDIRGVARLKFDVRAIWSNLNKRAAVLIQLPLPVQSAVRQGQLLVVAADYGYNYWLFIEDQFDRNRLRSGLWIGQNPLALTPGIKWTESNHKEIATYASNVDPEMIHDLLVAKIDGVDYVWFFDDGKWNMQGELAIISRKVNAVTDIRGVQIRPESDDDVEIPRGVSRSPKLRTRVEMNLSDISHMRQQIFSVYCRLEIDAGLYAICFESDDELIDRILINRTSELISILRNPLIEGIPLQSSRDQSVYMTWNPYNDISYGELQLLKPYVERKTPYLHVMVPLPLTCSELLGQPPIITGVTVSHDEDECSLVDGSASAHGLCWRIKSETSNLSAFDDSFLSDIDVSSLISSGEVFLEGRRCRLNISFEVEPSERRGIVFRESRRIARALDLKPVRAGAFLELDSEQLRVVLTGFIDGVGLEVYSSVTDERLVSGQVIPPAGKWNIEDIVDSFITDTREFIDSYFGENEKLVERIIDYNVMLEDLKNKLKRIKKGKSPLR